MKGAIKMKQEEFETKVKEMFKDVQKDTLKEAIRLFNCGGVSPEEFESDYRLPKAVLFVALKNITCNYRPIGHEVIEVVGNLEHF